MLDALTSSQQPCKARTVKQSHFINEETGTEKLNNWLMVIQSVAEQFGFRICALNPFAMLPLNHEIIGLA